MATARGGTGVRRYLQNALANLTKLTLPGAARAGANVVAEAARQNLGTKSATNASGKRVLIANAVKVKGKWDGPLYRARVYMKGEGAYVAKWLEYGTSAHFISVDPALSGGRTARRVNTLVREGKGNPAGTLIINGHAVGKTVHHDGADPYPFMHPALDHNETEAIKAAQDYIDKRIRNIGKGLGHNGGPAFNDDE
ncbi:MAG: hypothetical protein EOO77_02335 [Oxalobacteraceae bacterium]|nr:MAG: hypothetical protein EOO77_02335 [Oxalobacteraceae bacterium]